MCVLVTKESFTGVWIPSEERIFTSLKGWSQKRATDPHQLQNFRLGKNFEINKNAEAFSTLFVANDQKLGIQKNSTPYQFMELSFETETNKKLQQI